MEGLEKKLQLAVQYASQLRESGVQVLKTPELEIVIGEEVPAVSNWDATEPDQQTNPLDDPSLYGGAVPGFERLRNKTDE